MLRQSVKERKPTELSEEDRDYLEKVPFGNLVPLMISACKKKRSDWF
jgi:hypothetical protein